MTPDREQIFEDTDGSGTPASTIDLRDIAVVIAEERGIHWAPESDDVILGGLLIALENPDPAVSARADRSLKKVDPERLGGWLRAQLAAADPERVAEIAAVVARLRLIELVPDLVRTALDSSATSLEAIGGSLKSFPHFQELIDWIQAPPNEGAEEERKAAAEQRTVELLRNLQSTEANDKLTALGDLPEDLGPGPLADLVTELAAGDPSDEMRVAAMTALKRAAVEVRVPAADTILKRASVPFRVAALELLSGGTIEEMSLLVKMLHDKSPRVAKEAIALLGAQPAPGALAVLWSALLGVSRDRQELILDLLSRFDPSAVSLLARQVIGSPRSRERILGIWVLASVDPVGSRQLLLNALTDPAPEVRLEALGGMWAAQDAKVIEAVGGRVKDPEPSVRAIAVGVLGSLDPELSAGYLLDAAKDPDDGVREAAEEALLAQRAEAVAPVLVRGLGSTSHRRVAGGLLARLGVAAIPALLASLGDSTPEVRVIIGELLEELSAETRLLSDLDARSPEQRGAALDGLLAMGARDRVGAIAARLEDPVTSVRVRAAEVLGALGDERVLDALKRAFVSDPEMKVVSAVETALRALAGDQTEG